MTSQPHSYGAGSAFAVPKMSARWRLARRPVSDEQRRHFILPRSEDAEARGGRFQLFAGSAQCDNHRGSGFVGQVFPRLAKGFAGPSARVGIRALPVRGHQDVRGPRLGLRLFQKMLANC